MVKDLRLDVSKVLGISGAVFLLLVGALAWFVQESLSKSSADHDLIIRLDTKVDLLITHMSTIDSRLDQRQALNTPKPAPDPIKRVAKKVRAVAEREKSFRDHDEASLDRPTLRGLRKNLFEYKN